MGITPITKVRLQGILLIKLPAYSESNKIQEKVKHKINKSIMIRDMPGWIATKQLRLYAGNLKGYNPSIKLHQI